MLRLHVKNIELLCLRILIFIAINLVVFTDCISSQYKIIRVYPSSEKSIDLLLSSPISHSIHKSQSDAYDLILSSFEFDEFLLLKLPYTVISENAEETYLKQLESTNHNQLLDNNEYFRLGSIGGYFTLNEIYSEIDRMAAKYPDYFSKDSIGTSIEGRTIFSYCIGYSACSNNSLLPQVLITALHHAREPGSIFTVIYYLWDLFERLDSGNDIATYILNNRHIYLIPVINPDGVAFNEASQPEGGGLWRKNRRFNSDSTMGVDLNRNYGPHFAWDSPNNGSSIKGALDTYRGAEPFSEPETAAIRDFLKGKNINTAVNFHTFGDAIFYPLSYLVQECNDSVWYRQFLHDNYRNNRYLFGLDKDIIKYSTRGGADDYMYIGDDNFDGFLSMTCEVGSANFGFWSPLDIMLGNANKNLPFIENIILSADKNISLVSKDAVFKEGKFFIELSIANIGYNAIDDLKLKVKSLDNKVLLFNNKYNISLLKRGDTANIHIEYYPITSKNGETVELELMASLGYEKIIKFELPIFEYYEYDIFNANSIESAIFENDWFISEDNVTGKVLSSNSQEKYSNKINSYATFFAPEIQDSIIRYSIHFEHNFSIESNYDFGLIWAKNTNDEVFNPNLGEYLTKGANRQGSKQADTLYGFHGVFNFWHSQVVCLSNSGEKIKEFAFNLRSDKGTNMAGWKIRNLKLRVYPYITKSSVQIAKKDNVIISPNPVSDIIEISLVPTLKRGVDGSAMKVQIFDVLGIEVISESIHPMTSSHRMNIEKLPAGVYFIRIGDKVEKFVKM